MYLEIWMVEEGFITSVHKKIKVPSPAPLPVPVLAVNSREWAAVLVFWAQEFSAQTDFLLNKNSSFPVHMYCILKGCVCSSAFPEYITPGRSLDNWVFFVHLKYRVRALRYAGTHFYTAKGFVCAHIESIIAASRNATLPPSVEQEVIVFWANANKDLWQCYKLHLGSENQTLLSPYLSTSEKDHRASI